MTHFHRAFIAATMGRVEDPPGFRVLGALEVERGGALVRLTSGRQRAVLAALLAGSAQWVAADELLLAGWGERWPGRPTAALQTVVSRLRSTLGRDLIVSGPSGYRLPLQPHDVDARWFEALRDRAAGAPPAAAAQLLAAALGLWRGPAYTDFADREFARAESRRLEQLRKVTIEDYAELCLELDRPNAAITELQALLAIDPWREGAVGLLMRALDQARRPNDALTLFRTHRKRLVRELGVDPAPELQELQDEILRQAVPAARAQAPAPPLWLPTAAAFVGRERDMATLTAAVTAGRLVTVTGTGGVGKTRLVAESLPEISRRMATPVSVVELAATLPGRLVSDVAAGLGVDTRSVATIDSVVEYLRVGDLLLVLDNCEHVLTETRNLVDAVLCGCPGVRILTTSRNRLGAPGEQVLPLEPLPTETPPAAPGTDLNPSVRLFIDRLHRLRPEFPLSSYTLSLVAEACRRLDGLPLALELAATQASALGLEPLLNGLSIGLDMLADDGGGLRAVLERSYALLGDAEKRLLMAVSVFADAFDLDAAEQVCTGTSPQSAVTVLTRLIDGSLVTVLHGDRGVRYRLLAVVRAFAAERSERDGLVADARIAHARWVRSLAESAAQAALQPDRSAPYARLEEQRADVLNALAWATSAGEFELAAGIAGALRLFPHWRPDAETLTMICGLADEPRVQEAPAGPLAVAAGAIAALDLGALADAERLGGLALELARRPRERYLALTALGIAALYRGDHERSASWWHALLETPGLGSAQHVEAHASLALLTCFHGDIINARRHADAASTAARQAGAIGYQAFAAYATGEVYLLDNPRAAISVLRIAIAHADAANAGQVATVARIALLSALVRLGDHQEAAHLFSDLLHYLHRRGNWPQLWTSLRLLAELLEPNGHPDVALLLVIASTDAPSAPTVAGDDVDRYRRLQHRIRERLGAEAVEQLTSVAHALTPAEALEQALAALSALAPTAYS